VLAGLNGPRLTTEPPKDWGRLGDPALERRVRKPRAVLLAARLHTPAWTLRTSALLVCLATAMAAPASGNAQSLALSPETLGAYIAQVARAWEPYTTPDGRVIDPLDPADSGDNYGVIMLADVMLKAAGRGADVTLAETGERIVNKAASLKSIEGPFNLLAVASLLRDGQRGLFPPGVWSRIGGEVASLAARVAPSTRRSCFTVPGCYSNWRLVWSAGAAALLNSGALGATPPSNPATTADEISSDLNLAVTHAGAPAAPSVLRGARELSDPGSEPPSYHLLSCALLELIAEADPRALTPAIERLRRQAAGYALELMAPDGQLSVAGRSLDQSWVQAAGAAFGARQAARDPTRASRWRSFADRAFSYLLAAYPARPDGIIPIVPGLLVDWSPSIMDSYAALNQYEGLAVLPEEVVNLGEGWAVADGAVVASRVVVLQPVSQGLAAGV
jgi:hypothetical protein